MSKVQSIGILFSLFLAGMVGSILLSETAFAPVLQPAAAQTPAPQPPDEAQQLFLEGLDLANNPTPADWQRAIEKLQAARQLWQDNPQKEAIALGWLGQTYTQLGQLDEALASHQKRLELSLQQPDRASQALAFTSVAKVYTQLGQYQAAIAACQQALSRWSSSGTPSSQIQTLLTLGSIFAQLGDPQEALSTYDQALSLAQTVDSIPPQLQAGIFNNQGRAYSDTGNLEAAAAAYAQALQTVQQVSPELRQAAPDAALALRQAEGRAFNNIGFTYAKQQQYTQAIAQYEQALPIWQELNDKRGEASTLTNLGVAYAGLGDSTRAIDYYNRAIPLRQTSYDKRGEATTLYQLARVERDRGEFATARTHIEAAIAIVESLREQVSSEALRRSFFASVQDLYELYIDLLMQQHQLQPNAGYDITAFEASERSRARTLLELLNTSGTDISEGVDPQLRAQERDLQQQINALAEQQAKASGEEQSKALETELQDLFRQLDLVQGQIRATSPRYADLTQPQPLSLSQIQKRVLKKDTIILAYALGETRSYLWAITKEEITSYELPPRSQIDDVVKELRGTFTSVRKRNDPVAVETVIRTVSDLVLAPVADRLHQQHVAIVGDGSLNYLPFAALSLPGTEYTPLIAEHEVVSLPSASTIAILRQQERLERPTKVLATIADPVFKPDDARLQDVLDPPDEPIASAVNNPLLVASAREIGLSIPPNRLPGTLKEAQEIAALIPPEQQMQALGFDANRQVVLSGELSQYRILHFATHGFLNSTHPALSGIVLSLIDREGQPQEGFMRLQDVYNLRLGADLVVLSACQTGLGQEVKGEGVIGLTRGFMYAGVPRVIVSFWSVDDRGTAALMSRFYQELLQEELSPAAALRQAQLALLQQEEFKSPYYWAAFGLQGEWQ
jgi:CHAT domain-containing protein/Tfp pilus assembly protein PilF